MQNLFIAGALALAAAPAEISEAEIDAFTHAFAALDGAWTGELSYRDYRTDRRVSIPHDRRIESAPDGSYVITHLAFTDPGYRIYSAEIAALNGAEIAFAYAGGGEIENRTVTLDSFSPTAAGWRAVMSGRSIDAGAPVEARYTWVLDGIALTVTKDVRTDPDGEFQFRNGAALVRIARTR